MNDTDLRPCMLCLESDERETVWHHPEELYAVVSQERIIFVCPECHAVRPPLTTMNDYEDGTSEIRIDWPVLRRTAPKPAVLPDNFFADLKK